MKEPKRKYRDWKNDNRIMKKYGVSIHDEIERTFKKAAANQIKHKTLRVIINAISMPPGAQQDISQKVSWIV